MGSRGGGRGRGRFGGGGFRYAKQEPFVLFPDIELPAIDQDKVKKAMVLASRKYKLEEAVKDLPYFLKETFADDEAGVDIERHSDKGKKRSRTNRASLENSGYLTLQPGYFPLELVRGAKRRAPRKVEWNPNRDLKKLDMLLEREEKFNDEDPKSKKKDGEEDEEDDEEVEPAESEDEYSSTDYNEVGDDFQDDEDEYNQASDHEEGNIYY